MNNTQMLQLLGALMNNSAPSETVSPAAPAKAAERQTFKVTRGVNAFKSQSSGYNKDRWMMSIGDFTTRWNGAVIPKSAFVKGEKCLVTRTQWEVTFGVTNGGRLYAISAVDTKVPTASGDTLDDIVGETLDDVGDGKTKPSPDDDTL